MSRRCMFCGSSADDEPEDFIAAVGHCTNCRVDLMLKGQWTGHAWAALNAIRQRKGLRPFTESDNPWASTAGAGSAPAAREQDQ